MGKAFIVMLKYTGAPDKALDTKLSEISTQPFRVLQFAAQAAVIGLTWDGNARSLWDRINKARITGLSEMLIVQAGDDWCGMRDRASSGWLVKHLGDPPFWGTDD